MPPTLRSSRSRSIDRSRRARRVGAAVGLAALALAAGAAVWNPSGPSLAGGSSARGVASAALGGLARLLAPPPRQRVIVTSSVGVALLSIPLALAFRRRRARERRRAQIAAEQQARASQVFEAAFEARPLRRAAEPAAEAPRADAPLPPVGAVPAEVVACAAELEASAVREAAARAVLLRAASERSETRRRAAALRARARSEKAAEAPAVEAATPTVEVQIDAPPVSSPASAAPAQAEPSGAAPAASHGGGRVAILRASGPLTFEWLEHCLARDPEDLQARLDLCTALLVAERFADAERVAREGLARDASNGRLLLRLSEALSGLERIDEALEIAVHAVRGHRSRKAILQLTRLSAVARRFSPGDGARLRKALESRPQDPVFLHALGAFEAQHGSPREALPILRLALRQERNPRWRRVVSREIARLRAQELGEAGGDRRRAAS